MLGYAAEQRKRRYQFGVGRVLFLTRSDPIATWYTSTASAAFARMGQLRCNLQSGAARMAANVRLSLTPGRCPKM